MIGSGAAPARRALPYSLRFRCGRDRCVVRSRTRWGRIGGACWHCRPWGWLPPIGPRPWRARGDDAWFVHEPDLAERHRNGAFANPQIATDPNHHCLDFAAAIEDQFTDIAELVAVIAAVDIKPSRLEACH